MHKRFTVSLKIAEETIFNSSASQPACVCVCGEAHARAPLFESGVDLAATVTCITVTIVMESRRVGGVGRGV